MAFKGYGGNEERHAKYIRTRWGRAFYILLGKFGFYSKTKEKPQEFTKQVGRGKH